MRNRSSFSLLRWGSLGLIILAVVFAMLQLVRFSRLWANFPSGLTIAGIPVAHLNRQEAGERLLTVFSQPVELHYNEAIIHLSPTTVGFALDMDSMLAAADIERTRQPFWSAFGDYLWGRPSEPVDIPLAVTYSEERLVDFLESEISTRYDQPATPAVPVPGTVNFQPGSQGTSLDTGLAVQLIEAALRSTTQRTVTLPLQRTSPIRPTIQNLEILVQQTIDLSGFDGVIGIYLADLQTGQEISFVQNQGEMLSYPPDVSFTGSSTIKIPIMVSVFRRLGDEYSQETAQNLEDMIARSINPASDWLMANVLDAITGPLIVTDDMQSLGLVNTFLAGYFYLGAPLLDRYDTPGNQRTDIDTEPDPYNQTTPSEIGSLLVDIYQCASESPSVATSGRGALLAAFPGEITQAECQTMIDYLTKDKIALLIEAGVPDGTNVAHKHGWVQDLYGIIHDMSDAAIVFSPGGDYVLTVFMYHPVQIVFDPANELVKDISSAVYNYYNVPQP
ncbi:MAG TPA: serine hydrolase [Anaerolineales bacterium]|nr:serine hydrolase [Anaerolineales bacterium]